MSTTPLHLRAARSRGSFCGYDRGSVQENANSPVLNTLIKECRDDERVEVVKKLVQQLENEGISIDTLNLNGTSAFVTAASFGSLSVLQLLHQRGADVNQTKRGSERTALHVAAENGHISVTEWLCDMGININVIDAKGFTALMCAAHSGSLGIVRILLERGADAMVTTFASQKSAFHIACAKGHREITECLLDHSVKQCTLYSCVDAKTSKGSTGFFLACKKGHVSVLKLLIERGHTSGINDINQDEKTPLMAACEGGHTEIVEILLAIIPNVDINKQQPTHKMTALHFAASVDNLTIINMLLSKGANMYLENKQRKKPYEFSMDPTCKQVLKPGYYALAVHSLPTMSVPSLTDITANLVESVPAKAVVGSLMSMAVVAGLSLLKARFK